MNCPTCNDTGLEPVQVPDNWGTYIEYRLCACGVDPFRAAVDITEPPEQPETVYQRLGLEPCDPDAVTVASWKTERNL